jgi:hypothetical protein
MKTKDLNHTTKIMTYCTRLWPALDIISKFQEYYLTSHDLAVDEARIGFKGRFHLKQYMPGKPTKWGIKAWGLTAVPMDIC